MQGRAPVALAFTLAFTAGCGFFDTSAPNTGAGPTTGAPAPRVTTNTTAAPATAARLVSLQVEVASLAISEPGAGQQVTVAGVYDDGHVRDLTRAATWTSLATNVATIGASGWVTPVAAGTATVRASMGGLVATGTIVVMPTALSSAASAPTTTAGGAAGVTWTADVFPLFQSVLSCKGCHDAAGPGRMKLTLDAATDYKNVTTSGLLDLANPTGSLLLQKATRTVPHGGGALLSVGSPPYETIRAWIAAGAPYGSSGGATGASAPMASDATIVPDGLVVNPPRRNLVDPGASQQLVVVAWWRSGALLDVTRVATYASSAPAVLSVDASGLAVAGSGSGKVVVFASYQGVPAEATFEVGATAALVGGDQPSILEIVAGAPPTASAPAPTTGTTAPPPTTGTTPPPSNTGTLTYVSDLSPLLTARCTSCHNASFKPLTSYASVMATGAVVAGNPLGSLIVTKTQPGGSMSGMLTASEAQLVWTWVQEGALEGTATAGTPPPPPPPSFVPPPGTPLTYSQHVAPLLAARCVSCHGAATEKPLATYEQVLRTGEVTPGNTSCKLVKETRPGGEMSQYLGADEATMLKDWIAQGAKP